MRSRWLVAVMSLPMPVVVLIPTTIILAFRSSWWAHTVPTLASLFFWLGASVALLGGTLSLWSVLDFARHGRGTPAPWDPPARFVVSGPYCFVRNPMILGVFLLLLGEAVLLRSVPLFFWFAVFVAGNLVYIPLVEEKGLERRFGVTYSQYRRSVPRWCPRRTAWHPAYGAIHEKRPPDGQPAEPYAADAPPVRRDVGL